MLSLTDTRLAHNCQGYTRREFLRIGSLGLGALTLPNLLALKAQAAAAGKSIEDKSVIFLFLQGGPSHIETFDPKMSAPIEIRSIYGETPTRLPGVTFAGHFQQMASIADQLAVVRSYASKNSGHSYQEVASGRNPLKATMGAIYSRIAGTNNPVTGMPSNVLLLPEAVNPGLKLGSNFETSALPTLTEPGLLGPSYAAFNPIGGGQLKKNMELKIPQEQFANRRALLGYLDRLKRNVDASGLMEGMDTYQQQAFDVITGGVADAFDLSQEDSQTVAKYDTSHLFDQRKVQQWGDMRRSSNQLGKQLLLARRLCERGCGFVTVSDCGWDMHSNNNSPKNLGGMKWLGPQVDHAVTAFVKDCQDRGLSDKILLVVTGEMGRTPRINKNGGRDHYGELTPLVFAGGGLNMGQVIGQSDSGAARPATREYTPANLLATVMHTLFDAGELRLQREVPRDILATVEDGQPIPELF